MPRAVGGRFGAGVLLAGLVLALFAVPGLARSHGHRRAAAPKRRTQVYGATIRRTAHGIPHIEASSFAGLGYGYGYAFAQDNLCTMADDYVTVEAAALRATSGRTAPTYQRGNGVTGQQPQLRLLLPADHSDSTSIEQPARRSSRRSARSRRSERRVRGYVAGYNRYLARHRRRQRRARPDLPRQALGAADHRDGRLPALLPAGPARERRRGDRRDRRGAAADAGACRCRRPTVERPADRAGADRTSCR